MTITIDSNYVNQFSDNLHNLLEQGMSKFRGIFTEEERNGEKHFFDRLGSFTATEVVGRLQDTDLQDPAHSRRMCTVRRYAASTYLDDIDKLKMIIDPTNDYVKKLASAHGRNFDDIVIDALIGTAATGKDGSGSQALPSGQKVAHGSVGVTIAKLHSGLEILNAAEVDTGLVKTYIALDAGGITDMFTDSTNQLTSFDYQMGKPISTGDLPKFRGLNILRTQRIPKIDSSTFRAILFTEDAVKIAIAKQLEVKPAERADKNFAIQLSTYMFMGAVRIEDEQVVEIAYQ